MKQEVYEKETGKSTSSTGSKQTGPSESEKQEMMKKAEAASAPGPQHKVLEHFVGSWKCDVKCWMDPAAPPNQSSGTAKGAMIMNGRFIQEDFKGDMMGQPFHGRTVIGFNNIKKQYQLTWIDDLNSAIFACEGKGDSKTITLEGLSSCPATGRNDIPMKLVYRIQSPKTHIFEMFDGSRDNAMTMQITYTRQ